MRRDADGVERYNVEWSIEGKPGFSRDGKRYGQTLAEVESLKQAFRESTFPGETATFKVR